MSRHTVGNSTAIDPDTSRRRMRKGRRVQTEDDGWTGDVGSASGRPLKKGFERREKRVRELLACGTRSAAKRVTTTSDVQ